MLMKEKKEEHERKKEEQERKKKEREEEQERKRKERERKIEGKKEATTTHQPARDRQPRLVSTSTQQEGEASTTSSAGQSSNSIDGEDGVCTFCFQPYTTTDGLDWVECACGRWVHELCLEDVFVDDSGKLYQLAS